MKLDKKKLQPLVGELKGNGTIFGRDRGHIVRKMPSRSDHKRALRANPSPGKVAKMERKELAMNIAKEICGHAPYEKKAMDLARRGEDKKMKKFLKKRLGTLRAARKKQEALMLEVKNNK